jgi:RNA polymerase sigma factor (sigma-70 family)
MEQDTLKFITDFVNHHPQFSRSEEVRLLTLFRSGFDTKEQMLKEKARIERQLLVEESAIERTMLMDDIVEIDNMIKTNPLILSTNKYRNKLIEHNLKLIAKIARYYTNNGLPYDDVFQEGSIGFLKAIERFDIDAGVKLATYATWWIRQAITRAISNKNRVIRLPVHVLTDVSKVLSYIKKNDIPINNDAILYVSEHFGFSEEKSQRILNYILSFNPINATYDANASDDNGEDETNEQEDYFDDTSDTKIDYLRDTIDDDKLVVNLNLMFDKLSPLHKFVLTHRLGLGGHDAQHYVQLQILMHKEGLPIKKIRETIQSALRSLVEEAIAHN